MKYLDYLLTLIPSDPLPNLILGLAAVAVVAFIAWVSLVVFGGGR